MAVVSTGFFDGVHIGHQTVIKTLVRLAQQKGEEASVVTFRKHPRVVLQQDARLLRLLSSTDEKVSMLKSLAVDRVEIIDFSRDFASLSAEEYLREQLIARMGATCLVLGYDNRIGRDKQTAQTLGPLAQDLGIELAVVPPVGDNPVSSTKIRAAISEGKVEEAAYMLGYDYFLTGVVVPGKQYGRTIGFPTANMQMYDPLKLLPAKGVYLTEVDFLGRKYYGMTNVGEIVETHILDFSEYIYGLDISIKFKKRLRDMRRFVSGDDLKNQLAIDERVCRALCGDLLRL